MSKSVHQTIIFCQSVFHFSDNTKIRIELFDPLFRIIFIHILTNLSVLINTMNRTNRLEAGIGRDLFNYRSIRSLRTPSISAEIGRILFSSSFGKIVSLTSMVINFAFLFFASTCQNGYLIIRRIETDTQFNEQYPFSFRLFHECVISCRCRMPAFIFHERLIASQIHRHISPANRALRNQIRIDRASRVIRLFRSPSFVISSP